jgi:hypothetical protein
MLLVLTPPGQHAAGVVLCIGADGHVDAEFAEGGACMSEPGGEEHRGACTDVPIPTGGDADCTSFKPESPTTAERVLPQSEGLLALRLTPSMESYRAGARKRESAFLRPVLGSSSVVLRL